MHLAMSAIVAGQDVSARLSFTLDDGNNRAPLSLDLTLKPLPSRFSLDSLPAMDLHLTLKDLEISSWATLVDPVWMHPASGRITVDVQATTHAGAMRGTLKGVVSAAALKIAQGKHTGQPTDLKAEVDADVDLAATRFDIRKAELTGPGLVLSTKATITDRSIDGVRNVLVDLKVEELSRILAVVPEGSGLVPRQLKLTGPFAVHLEGDPKEAQFTLDLDKARVAWADLVDKQPGVPFTFKVLATREEGRVQLQPFAFIMADARLAGWLDLPASLDGPMEGALYSGNIKLSQVRSIFPVVARAARKEDIRLDGLVQVSAEANIRKEAQAVDLQVRLRDMDVRLPSGMLKGNGQISGKMGPNDAMSTAMEAHVNLTDLAVRARNGAGKIVLDKRRGLPVKADAAALGHGDQIRIQNADIQLGSTDIRVRGEIKGFPGTNPSVEVGTDEIEIHFDDWRRTVMAAKVLPPKGRLRTRVDLKGQPRQPSTLSLAFNDVDMLAGPNRIKGTLTLTNPTSPALDVDFPVVGLDFKTVAEVTGVKSIPRPGRFQAAVRVRGSPADLSTMDVTVEDLVTSVLGMRMTGKAQVTDFTQPRINAHLKVDRIDVDSLSARLDAPASPPAPATSRAEPAHAPPENIRAQLARLNGEVALEVGQVRYQAYQARDVAIRLNVVRGAVECEQLDLGVYRGTLSLSGFKVDPTRDWLNTTLVLHARDLDLAQIYDGHTRDRGRLSGRVDVDLALTARGMQTADLKESLQGTVAVRAPWVQVRSADLVAEIIKRLPPGASSLISQEDLSSTMLEEFQAEAEIRDQRVRLIHPMETRTVFGGVQLEGSAGMDSTLALVGSASLQPHFVGEMTGGRFAPPKAVLVPLKIGGTWSAPKVTGVDTNALARALGMPPGAATVVEGARNLLGRGTTRKPKPPREPGAR